MTRGTMRLGFFDANKVRELPYGSENAILAFNRAGDLLAVSSNEEVRIYEVQTGNETSRQYCRERVRAISFDEDGRVMHCASVAKRRSVYLTRHWMLPSDLLTVTCSRLTRNLSSQEWREFVGDEPYRKTCPQLPDNSIVKEPSLEPEQIVYAAIEADLVVDQEPSQPSGLPSKLP